MSDCIHLWGKLGYGDQVLHITPQLQSYEYSEHDNCPHNTCMATQNTTKKSLLSLLGWKSPHVRLEISRVNVGGWVDKSITEV